MDSDSYYQPPEDAWDVYEQKREQIVNDIWDMPLIGFIGEIGAGVHYDLATAIEKAVDELAQRTLEEYVEGMAEYEADREYHTRKEMDG